MPSLQPSEVSLVIHRLLFSTLLSVNVRAAGTMATANLDCCKKEKETSIYNPTTLSKDPNPSNQIPAERIQCLSTFL